jgi:hypothetical protein
VSHLGCLKIRLAALELRLARSNFSCHKNSVLVTIGPYQGCPGWDVGGSPEVFSGAVLIGPFEGRRWCGGCGCGLWVLNGSEPMLQWGGGGEGELDGI